MTLICRDFFYQYKFARNLCSHKKICASVFSIFTTEVKELFHRVLEYVNIEKKKLPSLSEKTQRNSVVKIPATQEAALNLKLFI